MILKRIFLIEFHEDKNQEKRVQNKGKFEKNQIKDIF